MREIRTEINIRCAAAAFIFAAVFLMSVLRVQAGEETGAGLNVTVKDMAGRSVCQDDFGNILASSDLLFTFNELHKPAQRISANAAVKDWLFCEAERKGDRENFTPVRNGKFRLCLKKSKEIRFLWLDRNSGETVEDPGVRGVFRIDYKELPDTAPGAELEYDTAFKGDRIYLSGKTPSLRIKPVPFAHTFAEITSNGEERLFEIEGERIFDLGEGEYSFTVWGEDGWGIRSETQTEISSFYYDGTKPSKPDISIGASGEGLMKKGVFISGSPVTVNPSSEDRGSGIDHYVFRVKNKYNKAEYEAQGFGIQLNPPFYGNVGVYAVDRAGNTSEVSFSNDIMADALKPGLTKYRIEKERGKKLRFILEAEDTLSGAGRAELSINNEVITKKNYEGEEKIRLEALMDEKDLKKGRNRIGFMCRDLASNLSSYEFTVNKEDERKEKDGEEEKRKEPELYLRGFSNFEISEGPVTFDAGVLDEREDRGRVIIERHDEDGNITGTYSAEPGHVIVTEEGNYVVRYIVPSGNDNYEMTGYFTIDRSAPQLKSLKSIDKKSFSSFAMDFNPLNIRDYTFVNGRMTLSGRDYAGERITEPGRYVLKLTATDELDHTAEETAEFVILSREDKRLRNIVSSNSKGPETVSENKTAVSRNDTVSSGKPVIKKRLIVSGNEERLSPPGSSGREITIYKNAKTKLILACVIAVMLMITVFVIASELLSKS